MFYQLIVKRNLLRRRLAGRRAAAGFTLIELMIVVVVIAILTAIAVPNYREYVARGRRAEARAGLLQAAQWMERVATATGTYPTGTLPASLQTVGSYTIANPAGTANTFNLVATRQGAQVDDKCGDFSLTNTGFRDATPLTHGASVRDCWGK